MCSYSFTFTVVTAFVFVFVPGVGKGFVGLSLDSFGNFATKFQIQNFVLGGKKHKN